MKDGLIGFEKLCEELWKQGKVKVPLHLSGGNEDKLVDIFRLVREEDWVISTHRNHYHYLLKGGKQDELIAEITGNPAGVCGGHSGSMHTTDLGRRFLSSCLVGCGAPVAVGLAVGIKRAGGPEYVWCFVGDGAVDQGMFFESLVYAEANKLPVTFIVEDNDRSVESGKLERGVLGSVTREAAMRGSPHVVCYSFKPTYPHVGDGSFISF